MPAFHQPRFNPVPRVKSIEIGPRQYAHVIDDVLLNPEALVELATLYPERLSPSEGPRFAGLEWWMPPEFGARLEDFSRLHVRRLFSDRRLVSMRSRLSLRHLAPEQLSPRHWLGHLDVDPLGADDVSVALVLYLFRDSAHGGTSFFRPLRPARMIRRLIDDAIKLDGPSFTQRYGIGPGDVGRSNDYFECVCRVPARWNRMVLHDGAVWHQGHVGLPERLSADPRSGRLTLNGFISCVQSRATA